MSVEPGSLGTWLAIVGIALTTLVTRAAFLVLPEGVRLPPLAERALRYAPACALAAIVVPDLIAVRGQVVLGLDNPRLVAAAVAAAFFVATRSLVGTIAVGMAAFTALRLLG